LNASLTGGIKAHDNAAFGVEPQGYGLVKSIDREGPGRSPM
jgi:hypothetical protein